MNLDSLPLWAPVLAALAYAAFVWWFGTGLVLMLEAAPGRRSPPAPVPGHAVAGLLALLGVVLAARHPGPLAATLGFTAAVALWGWHELAFLSGRLTGPRQGDCTAAFGTWRRWRQAVAVIAWHELALIACGLLLAAACWDTPNPVGAWTYAALWGLRLSAKLNLFLGVRNFSEDFLPARLAHLRSYFRRRGMNPLLPASLLVGAWLVHELVAGARLLSPGEAFGQWLVIALIGLGLVEHVLLVLPLPAGALNSLWRWAMPAGRPEPGRPQ